MGALAVGAGDASPSAPYNYGGRPTGSRGVTRPSAGQAEGVLQVSNTGGVTFDMVKAKEKSGGRGGILRAVRGAVAVMRVVK